MRTHFVAREISLTGDHMWTKKGRPTADTSRRSAGGMCEEPPAYAGHAVSACRPASRAARPGGPMRSDPNGLMVQEPWRLLTRGHVLAMPCSGVPEGGAQRAAAARPPEQTVTGEECGALRTQPWPH